MMCTLLSCVRAPCRGREAAAARGQETQRRGISAGGGVLLLPSTDHGLGTSCFAMDATVLYTWHRYLQAAYQHAIDLARAAGGLSAEDLADAHFGLGEALACCAEQVLTTTSGGTLLSRNMIQTCHGVGPNLRHTA